MAETQRLKSGEYQNSAIVKSVIADLEKALTLVKGNAPWCKEIDAQFISTSYSHFCSMLQAHRRNMSLQVRKDALKSSKVYRKGRNSFI